MDVKNFRLKVRSWTTVWGWALVGSMGACASPSAAQELAVSAPNLVALAATAADGSEVTVPDRVAANPAPSAKPHPLDPALLFAQDKLEHLREHVNDYEAVMIKQERIDGTLLPAEYMNVKIRNRRERAGRQHPFSVYMKFLRPNAIKGREVIYVENHNDGNIVAHEAGVLGMIRVNLAPRGTLAMRGNRYPITDAGIENLVEKLIERGNRDRAQGLCDVQFFENAKVMDRTCTMIQVKHEVEKPDLDFHIGRIYIDDEHQVPIRYEAYLWPEDGETELPLLESYTYAKLKLNVGLTDTDFDPDNDNYEFP